MNNVAATTIVCVLVGLSSGAIAGPPESAAGTADSADKVRAKELHALGLRHYKSAAYSAAIDAFRDAYASFPAPGILFNLAQAYRRASDCESALATYQSYLVQTAGQTTPQRVSAASQVRAMSACVAATSPQPVSASAAAPPSLDGAAKDELSNWPPGRRTRIAGLASVGLGTVFLGAASAFALQARSTSNELDDFFAAGGQWTAKQARLERDGKRANRFALGFTVAGGAAIVGGAVAYVLGLRSGAATRAPIVISPTSSGGSLVWSATF